LHNLLIIWEAGKLWTQKDNKKDREPYSAVELQQNTTPGMDRIISLLSQYLHKIQLQFFRIISHHI